MNGQKVKYEVRRHVVALKAQTSDSQPFDSIVKKTTLESLVMPMSNGLTIFVC